METISPIDIAVLSSPVPNPGETSTIPGSSPTIITDNNTQGFSAVSKALTSGSGVTPAYGSGNRTKVLETGNQPTQVAPSTDAERQENTVDPAVGAGSRGFDAGDADRVGANIGGMVKTSPEDVEMDLKYATADIQEDAARAEELEAETDEFVDAYDKGFTDKSGDTFVGKKGARKAKRADRRADRDSRKGLSKAERKKLRKEQRAQRKSAYDMYKGEIDFRTDAESL